MFINIENGKVKLYDLRIYKKFAKVKNKLKLSSPYEYIYEKNTWYSYEFRDGNDFRILQSYKKVDVVEYNDFFSSNEDLYECKYLVYHLNKIFLMLDSLEKNDYSKLDLLNQYINCSIIGDSQILFEKYRKDILMSMRLVEVLYLDVPNFMEIYNLILKKSDGDIRKLLEKLKEHIYYMDLEGIPKLILKK